MDWRRNALHVLVLLLAAAAVRAQNAPPTQISTSVSEVVVDVVVHNRHGKIVRKLDPDEISVYDNGVKQDIRSVRLVSGQEVRMEDAPPAPGARAAIRAVSPMRTVNIVCMVFQDLAPETRKAAMDAALLFLKNDVGPGTYIGVFTLDPTGVNPMVRFTNNTAELSRAIRRAAAGQLNGAAGSSQQVFTALNQEMGTVGPMTPPPGAAPTTTSTSLASLPPSPYLGATMDASVMTGDDASIAVNNPLGRQGIHNERVYAMREMTALKWLVAQLSQMPFRKTVLLFSPGINRPGDQFETWKNLIRKANDANITFYAAELTGSNVSSPLAPVRAGIDQTSALSAEQGNTVTNLGDAANRSQQFDIAEHAAATANQEGMLRDLAESTGGFLITDLGQQKLARIMDDVQTHYEITYRPSSDQDDGTFHKIEVKLARADLRVEARPGYYAVPADPNGSAPTLVELAGLRALNTTPLPHSFDYRAEALRYPRQDGHDEAVVVFDVPRASVTATPVPEAHEHRLHASFFGFIKDAQGKIVDQFSADVPEQVADANLSSALAGRLSFEKHIDLAPGQYSLETSVMDWETGRSSTSVSQFALPEAKGPLVSSVAFVRRSEKLEGPADPADPLEQQDRRIVPTLFTRFSAGAKPSVFFRVYPEPGSSSHPLLRAQFLLNGVMLADQKADLPAPDASGSIPVLIEAPARPGSNELRISVSQGDNASAPEAVRYTVDAK